MDTVDFSGSAANGGAQLSRRGFLWAAALSTAAVVAGESFVPQRAQAAEVLTWPVPTGAKTNTINGKTVLTCYSPSTTATMSEILGLSNPSFYANEYNDKNYAEDRAKSPTLGIWGSAANAQPDAYLSNLLYKSKGNEVDDKVTAVLGSALQGATQFAAWDEEAGVPLFMKHRPAILAIGNTDTWKDGGNITTADCVKVINSFEKGSANYQEDDENYNPSFVDFRAHYGDKLGYMYDMWSLSDEATKLLAADSTKTARYGAPADAAALVEQFMLAAQYAVLREITCGNTYKKTVAVVGGVSDQTSGVIDGVDTTTMRARIDGFDASSKDFTKITSWGSTTNFNVRYYHAAAALENCCTNIIDLLGYSEEGTADYDENAPIIKDSKGIFWARPEALMQCEAVIVRTQTTVTTIPGLDELYKILRAAGYEDENAWPAFFTGNPTLGGYGASNCSQYFWWYAYLFFVYPEVINPVYMSAFLLTDIYHIASSYISDAMEIICKDMSLPDGCELSINGYSANDIRKTFAKGLEWYLLNKESVDEEYPNLAMTEQMATWLTSAKKSEMGVRDNVILPYRVADDNVVDDAAQAFIASGVKSADTVVIAGANSKVDAILAGPLAALYKAPVLLVSGNTISETTKAAITYCGASKYIIVGSKTNVPAAIETALKGMGLKAARARISGSTDATLANKVYAAGKGKWGKIAIVATTADYPGLVAASAYACAKKAPIFLLKSKKLPSVSITALKKFKTAYLVGNTSSISTSVKKKVKAKSVKRWSGSGTYGAALAAVKAGISAGLSSTNVVFASGASKKALAAGRFASYKKAVVVPVSASNIKTMAKPAKAKKLGSIFVYGNTSGISAAGFEEITDIFNS